MTNSDNGAAQRLWLENMRVDGLFFVNFEISALILDFLDRHILQDKFFGYLIKEHSDKVSRFFSFF